MAGADKKSEQVYRWLLAYIDENKFSGNLKLPSENALCRRLDALGLRVPRDVSVVSFNNTEASRYHNPPLSTFDLQPYQLGVRAMNLMLDMLTGAVTAPTSINVPFTLIQRQSVADCREGD